MQAVGLYDHWIDVQQVASVEAEQWGQHAVQAYVWGLVGKLWFCARATLGVFLRRRQKGCDRVAAVEENVVVAFTEVGGDDNNRFTVTLNQAYKVGRRLWGSCCA